MRAIFVLAAFVSLLVATAPAASAAPSCGRKVLDDWYDGRIDGTYPLHCYDDAIEIIPRDVRDYSSAEDDIKRALQSAMRGTKAPPNSKPPATHAPGDDPTGKTTEATPATPSDPGGPDAEHPLGESASSVPVPLLILAGLALLLVAGGSAGYLIRRFQNRRMPPPTA